MGGRLNVGDGNVCATAADGAAIAADGASVADDKGGGPGARGGILAALGPGRPAYFCKLASCAFVMRVEARQAAGARPGRSIEGRPPAGRRDGSAILQILVIQSAAESPQTPNLLPWIIQRFCRLGEFGSGTLPRETQRASPNPDEL